MSANFGLVLDCSNPTALAVFWSEALGYTIAGGAGNYVMLLDPDGARPKLLLQGVQENRSAKNRMHLDIDAPDVESEVSRLETYGARRLGSGTMSEHGHSWVTMVDPEGNEFCVCNSEPG
jgi:predicted enzyme related to lactoylglutathione lyase